MPEGYFHVKIAIPEPSSERGAADWALLCLRPLWPLMRFSLTLLPPGTPRRVRAVRQTFPFTFAAINRQDYVFLRPHFSRDYRIHVDPTSIDALELEPSYSGKDAIDHMLDGWNEAFSEWRWEVANLIDGPDIWLGLGEMVGVGASSGIELRRSISVVSRTRRGKILSQRLFWEWEDALADAGLPPLDQIPAAP